MLSDVFKYKDREARRVVLDRYSISAEDKNEFLNAIEESGSQENIGNTIKYLKCISEPSQADRKILSNNAYRIKYLENDDVDGLANYNAVTPKDLEHYSNYATNISKTYGFAILNFLDTDKEESIPNEWLSNITFKYEEITKEEWIEIGNDF